MGEQYTMVGLLLAGISGLAGGAAVVAKTLWNKIEAKDQELQRKDATIENALRVLEKHADALPQVVEVIGQLKNALLTLKPESTKREKS